jgi:hypothetical protein
LVRAEYLNYNLAKRPINKPSRRDSRLDSTISSCSSKQHNRFMSLQISIAEQDFRPRFDLEAVDEPIHKDRDGCGIEASSASRGGRTALVPASACGREWLGGALAKRDISAWRKPLGLEWQWFLTRPNSATSSFNARGILSGEARGRPRFLGWLSARNWVSMPAWARSGTTADKTYGSLSPRVIHLKWVSRG